MSTPASIARMSSRRAGFTFLEALVGVAMVAMIAVACGTLVYSFSNLWLQLGNNPQQEHHRDGVTSFVQYCLDQSVDLAPDAPNRRFGWSNAPEKERPTIQFRLDKEHPFFVTEIRPFPEVIGWLDFIEDEGLMLIWHVDPARNRNRTEHRRSLLSRYVRDVEYGYWEEESKEWEYFSATAEGNSRSNEVPGRMRFIFGDGDATTQKYVRLHVPTQNVFVY